MCLGRVPKSMPKIVKKKEENFNSTHKPIGDLFSKMGLCTIGGH
jgi:hypothetical protein